MKTPQFLYIAIALFVGIVIGFALGVMTSEAGKKLLEDFLASEARAQVDRPRSLERPRFRVEYPRNWKVDSDDEDYDPDGLFSIDSPGSSYVQFTFSQGENDLDTILEIYLNQFRDLMSGEKEEALLRYAGFEGKGIMLQGKIMGFRERIRILALHAEGVTVTVVELAPISDLNLVQPGLDLIESSLRVLPAPDKGSSVNKGTGNLNGDAKPGGSGGRVPGKHEGAVPGGKDG